MRMISHKGYKYRIYPNEEQKELIAMTIGSARFVYNHMLGKSKEAYDKGEKLVSRNKFNYLLTPLKKEFPWLYDVDATALTSANDNLAVAFKKFFDKTAGFPKFHRKKDFGSYTSKRISGTNNISLGENFIRLPKLGNVKAKIHRLPAGNSTIKSATISQGTDDTCYVSVLFEYEQDITPVQSPGKVLGLDYKSDGLYEDSNGNIGDNHKYYRESHAKLAKEQRKLSHMIESHIAGYKTINGNRYPVYDRDLSECMNIRKQRIKVARIHRHIANQRMDNLHKKSTEIANRYDTVCVEDLNMKAMSNKGFGNGKATMDNGYGMFLNMLAYKLADRGKYFVKVDKWFPSSQICSCCGSRKKLKLSERVYSCSCGLKIDRDLNAAINIKNEGLRLLNEVS